MQYDVVIIGAGPAGYVAGIRAGQAGLKAVVIDKQYIGGMCLNWGCIPTKALLESAKLYRKIHSAADFGITGIDTEALGFDWNVARQRAMSIASRLSRGIEYLWKKNNVEFIKGTAKIISPTVVEAENRHLETKYILIATGTRPSMPDIKADIPIIGIEALMNAETAPQQPLIYGQGPTAIELAQLFQLMGRSPVLLNTSTPFIPEADAYINAYLEKKFKKDKLPVISSTEWKLEGGQIKSGEQSYPVDAIINAGKRKAILPESAVALDTNDGFLCVNEHLQTNVPNIYAIGDVNGKCYLAHAASSHGLAAVNHILGEDTLLPDGMYPLNIYSEPEIAQIGQTEQQLQQAGVDYKVSEFNLSANGKAMTEGDTEGVVRLLSEKKYGQVLGVQIIATNATDMIAEAGVLLELEGTIYDVARTVHAHPTVSEVFMEAGLVAVDQPVHK